MDSLSKQLQNLEFHTKYNEKESISGNISEEQTPKKKVRRKSRIQHKDSSVQSVGNVKKIKRLNNVNSERDQPSVSGVSSRKISTQSTKDIVAVKQRLPKSHKKKVKDKSLNSTRSSDTSSVIKVKIKAVKVQKGMVIRKRSNGPKINLNSFINHPSESAEFTTTASIGQTNSNDTSKSTKSKSKVISQTLKEKDVSKGVHSPSSSTSKANKNPITRKMKKQTKQRDVKKDNFQSVESSTRGKRRSHKASENDQGSFEPYISKAEAIKGVEEGILYKGVLRINPKFYTEAYVSQEDKTLPDFLIGTVADRNRALEGDIVVVKLKDEDEKDGHKKAAVVHILEEVHSRYAIGFISLHKEKFPSFAPRDKRMPRMNILELSLPTNFHKNASSYSNVLFMAQLINWEVPNYALGNLVENIGKSSDLKSETKAILLEHQIDYEPFPSTIKQYLPKSHDIPAKEFHLRKDLRDECIFTVDPLTARDLDDALSCKLLPNGNFEIGVHIADVAYYLAPDTPLDKMVANKATTTYLVDSTYHMLPQELCFLCSLLPGRDSLAFSVFWEMTPDAEIVSKQFSRTIINSCSKLAYEHAQEILDNPNLNQSDFPEVHGDFTFHQVCESFINLQKLAAILRQKRINNGAIRIDQIKLKFDLDSTGKPKCFYVEDNQEANRVIEEFMLLANITVAQRIYNFYPDMAFLRRHEEPNQRMLNEAKKVLEVFGFHINTDTSKDIGDSLIKYNTGDYLGYTRNMVLNHMLAKPMARAKYFCAERIPENLFAHFALSIPIYTHFTSPIRRYADIMVHRLLAASLGYTSKPCWNLDWVDEIAERCNRQKYNAKCAGQASCDLYLAHYVDKNQPFIVDAVVTYVGEKAFDVVTLQTGSHIRVATNSFPEGVEYKVESIDCDSRKLWKMNVIFKKTDSLPAVLQIIEMFQIVKISLKRKDKTNKFEGFIQRPSYVKQLSK